MAIEFVLLIIVAYLLGSVPDAYLAAKWSRRIDIRQYGSGNVGATNLWGVTSRWIAILVIIFDSVKGMVMVWIAQLMGLGVAPQVAVGLAAIVGHNWPVFLRFSGGRGILTSLGVAIILPAMNNLVPWAVMVALVIVAISTFVVHNVPLGVGVGAVVMPLVSWGLGEPLPITLGFLAIFLIAVIRRLAVPRAAIAASVSTRQLFLNRLLFDRDIRDRETWIHCTSAETSSVKRSRQ